MFVKLQHGPRSAVPRDGRDRVWRRCVPRKRWDIETQCSPSRLDAAATVNGRPVLARKFEGEIFFFVAIRLSVAPFWNSCRTGL